MEEVGGPKFMGEEEQLMGNSMKWACIYVYAVGKVAQSEGKVCGEEQMDRDSESNMDQFDGQHRSWV